jgi:predicted Na+-dependent transporter
MFFFEKKKQKTFAICVGERSGRTHHAAIAVGIFFSEKRALLP